MRIQRGPALTRMGYWMFTKKPYKWKKHSVSIIALAASFGQIWSLSDFSVVQVTSVENRESREHFSASASKIFPWFPFFYFGNLVNTSIRRGQICPQTWQHNYRNKILFLLSFTILFYKCAITKYHLEIVKQVGKKSRFTFLKTLLLKSICL